MRILSRDNSGFLKNLRKVKEGVSPSLLLCIVFGIGVGYISVSQSWKMLALLVGVLIVSGITLYKVEYALYLFFFLLLMTTDAMYEGMYDQQDFFALPEIDLPGLPSATNLLFLLMFSVHVFRHYLLDKRSSNLSFRYLIAYVIILIIALITGAGRPEATSDSLRLEFLKMFLPALAFYMFVNVLDGYEKVRNMTIVLFAVCVFKSLILDAFYLAGRGFPFGTYRIVSYDTAELMTFVTLLLVIIMMIVSGRIQGALAWITAAMSFPLAFAVVFSFRRGQWLGMSASLALLYLWSPYLYRKRVLPYLLGSILLLIPIVFFFFLTDAPLPTDNNSEFSALSSRFLTLFDSEQASNRHHLYESVQVIRDIMKSPLFGLGFASEHSPVDEHLGGWVEETQPLQIVHNTFLYVWMKMGLLGFLFFLWCCFVYARQVVRYAKMNGSSENWPLTVSIGSAIGLWFVHFMTGAVPFYLHISYLIVLFAAMVVSLIRCDRQPYDNLKVSASKTS